MLIPNEFIPLAHRPHKTLVTLVKIDTGAFLFDDVK